MRNSQDRSNSPTQETAAAVVLREAKILHKAVCSTALMKSLPVLRRLLEAKALPGSSLPELFRRKESIQRKHVLRMLAMEAGYPSWERYRQVLSTLDPAGLSHFDIARRDKGSLNLWFASLAEAEQYAAVHGGKPLRVGRHAVIFLGR